MPPSHELDPGLVAHPRRGPIEAKPRFLLLYDGDCPLCAREVGWLRKRDPDGSRLALEDISRPDFEAARYGRTHSELMARIHGVTPDGEVVEGIEVFRQAYRAIGLGWLWAPTRWPGLRFIADRAYAWFARNRLRLTGRADSCARCEAGETLAP